jgi:hypothetical protein
VGKVVSAGVAGLLIAHVQSRTCFMIIAALPFIVTCSSFVMKEDRVGGWCCGQGKCVDACAWHDMQQLRLATA